MSKESNELPEDIEVIGPGQMLAEARQKMNLTQQQVAEKLNFRVTLVDEIEHEIFDKTLPDTFNRGYLKNYAKLVNVTESEVLSSYEMLGVAAKQRTEMQSFSKITEKQAQHSRLMWVSYLILAALVASTVVFYLQDSQNNMTTSAAQNDVESPVSEGESSIVEPSVGESLTANENASPIESSDIQSVNTVSQLGQLTEDGGNTDTELPPTAKGGSSSNTVQESATAVEPVIESASDEVIVLAEEALESIAIFTFAGDCWVNIQDANGERIAYGIKKAGYVMELRGTAPFEVTVGKPELVQVDFNGQSIDMSKYNVGNIAKFTLPESS
ncbi:RodZ domain-containing protein [Thalassotalea euphylliae]|uniref:RodZ domain-containing protein n=1 Tax=Thalassotalea euphylliae TaxID=1655234 RepID=UPI0036295BEE